jgi:hypothetical protein
MVYEFMARVGGGRHPAAGEWRQSTTMGPNEGFMIELDQGPMSALCQKQALLIDELTIADA